MKTIIFFLVLISSFQILTAQSTKYSTSWFGPNANPVPEFTDVHISSKTTVSLMGDSYFGYGDNTQNGFLKIEIPLLPKLVSIKLFSTILESYQVTDAVSNKRGMKGGNTTGKAIGDIYIQTRISLLKESKYVPAIIFNSTLKTASGSNFSERRYFDTPGYYFDLEIGKSIYTKGKFISEIRSVLDAGFMCWETTESTQDDAPMYGGKIIIGNAKWKLENSVSGYFGWMHTNKYYSADYGDAPKVYTLRFLFLTKEINYFVQYLYGINDFPYQQIRVGSSLQINKLTPKFNPSL